VKDIITSERPDSRPTRLKGVLSLRFRQDEMLDSIFRLSIILREAVVLANMFRPRRNDEGLYLTLRISPDHGSPWILLRPA